MTPLREALGAAISAAQAAGKMLREAMHGGDVTATTKSNRHDMVTEFDRRAESIIVERLRADEWETTARASSRCSKRRRG